MMGPSHGSKTRSSSSTRKSSRRRTLFKNHHHKSSTKNQESPALSPLKADSDCPGINQEICSTPKAERFRIPEITTCPPAPKKRRTSTNCSLRRTSISFFSHPDIELFFNIALCGIIPAV